MSYELRIRPRAIAEAKAIVAYEEQRSRTLAERFLKELEASYRYVEGNPLGFQVRFKEFRQIGSRVIVYQIRHTSRRPNKRLGP
ncbi:MAG: hypothetical protein ABI432_07550 [Flavobacteriales bacterium]